MPLWSLTQERVEKLRRQIGDVELEVDMLIKLSKEDLWNRDLDHFIAEWRAQLDEEYKRKRRINNMGRRTSKKVKVGASGATIKKRKGLGDYDDDDFDDRPKSKKPAPPKVKRTEIVVEKKEKGLAGWLSNKGTQGKNPTKNYDGNSSELEPEPESAGDTITEAKKVKPRPKTKTVPAPEDTEMEEIVTKPVARKARAVAAKPIRDGIGSESDDSNGDDLLGDITNMVKGLPGGSTKSSTDSKSIFSTSRAVPNSRAGLKPPPPLAAPKSYAEISDDDDTNFMALVPQQSPRRSINVTKNALLTDDEDEDEEDIRPLTTNKSRYQVTTKPSKPAPAEKAKPVVKSESGAEDFNSDFDDDIVTTIPKPTSRPAPSNKPKPAAASKPSKAPAPKASVATAAAKKDPLPKKSKITAPAKKPPPALSPAAKAYAAKQAKSVQKTRLLDSEDEADAVDAMADDLLDSPVGIGAGAGARDREGKDSTPPAVVVRKAGQDARPARRAAAQAAEKKKLVYVVSDDDDEEEDDSDGAGFGGGDDGEEESGEDFEDSE